MGGFGVANQAENNGRGNPKRIMWESNKEATYNMQDALISAESLAMLVGTAPEKDVLQVQKKDVLTIMPIEVDDGVGGTETVLQVELEETPTSESGYPLFVFLTEHGYDIGEEVPVSVDDAEGYEIDGKVITFIGEEYKENDKVIVDYYYNSDTTAKRIVVDSSKFPGYYKLEADTIWTREHDGALLPAKFTMPRIKIASSFTIENAAEGDPSVFDFVAECFPDDQNRMVIIDIIE